MSKLDNHGRNSYLAGPRVGVQHPADLPHTTVCECSEAVTMDSKPPYWNRHADWRVDCAEHPEQ